MRQSADKARVDPLEIRPELERILASGTFAKSGRARGMLRYIIQEDLAGRAEKLKGCSIAQDVFGKSDDFDPAVDAVVRFQAKRLHDQLAGYYASEGSDNPIEIRIPRGTYIPHHSHRNIGVTDEEERDQALDFDKTRAMSFRLLHAPSRSELTLICRSVHIS